MLTTNKQLKIAILDLRGPKRRRGIMMEGETEAE